MAFVDPGTEKQQTRGAGSAIISQEVQYDASLVQKL